MLVGPAGGGKTTTRQILKRALVVLPTIQAREQQQPLGTGDYPEEIGSLKTTVSFTVRHQIDVSFSCVCPVIDNEFRHSIVKVAVGSRVDPQTAVTMLYKVF